MYCSHFSLQRLPFNNTPDPAFYYSTPDHEEALATLQYAAQQRKGFVLVTGEVGAGKTLIGRLFLRHIDPGATVAVISNTHLNGRQLLAAICSEFGIAVPPESSNLELTQRLQEYLVQQFARDRHVIVLLDEGQNLPDESFEELRMLGNLEADDAKLLQVCILGQPELRDRFRKPSLRQLDQRLFRRFHLSALNRQQTGEYIRHRLNVAGAQNDGLFTAAAVDRIFAASRGIPRLVNQICDNALLTGYGRDVLVIDAEVIDLVLERDVSLSCSDQPGSSGSDSALLNTNAREAIIDASESRKLSELALEQARQMATQIERLAAGPELQRAELEKITERQNELQKIVAGATTRWLAAQEKLEGYRREIKTTLDAVTARCDAIQTQVGEVAANAAPAEDIQEIRESQLREISRVMAALDRQHAEASQEVERLKQSLADTTRRLTTLSSESISARDVERLIAQQDARIAETVSGIEQGRNATDGLIRTLEQRCEATQRALESLRQSSTRRADQADASIEQLATALARAEGELAGLRQEIAAGLGRAHEAIAQLEANSGREDVEQLRVEGIRVRAEQAEALSQLGRRVEEQTSALQRFREVVARQSGTLSRKHRSYFERLTEKLAEQSTQLAAMRSELAQREPELQRRLQALAERFASREDVEGLRRLAEELQAGQVTIEQVRTAQRAEVAAVASELGEQRRMLEAHLQELIARVQADEAQGEQRAVETEGLRAAMKAQRVDLETLAGALEQRCDDLRTRIDALPLQLGGIEETRAATERNALDLINLRADLQDYRLRFETLLAQLSSDADRTRAGLEAVADRTAVLEAAAEGARSESAALRGDLEALVRKQSEDVSELLRGLSEQRRSLEAGIDEAVRQVAQTHDQLTALQSTTATSSELDVVRARHAQDMETVMSALAERRTDLDTFAADVDRRCREMLEEVQTLAATQVTPEQLQALRDEHAARMATMACEIEQRGQVFERAIQDVAERCRRTQDSIELLTAKTDATAGDLQDLRRDSEEKLSGIVHRLNAEHAAHQHEVAELETALSQGVAGLERRLQQVSSELGRKVREATRRVGELEQHQQAPLRIDLTPEVRGELAELVTNARQEKEEIRAALERASAMSSHLHNTSARVQEVMQHWVDGASEVRRQSEQLRTSASKAGEILAAMQRCHEALDAKLNSQRWQSELQRGEKLSARLEAAAAEARTASQQLSALLADFDRARSDVDGWTRRQEQATLLSERLSKLLAEAQGAAGHIDKTLENRKRLLSAIAKNTGNLVSMIQSARIEDEERRPTAPAPAGRTAASTNDKPRRQVAISEAEQQTPLIAEDRRAALRPAASIRWPRFQPEPLTA